MAAIFRQMPIISIFQMLMQVLNVVQMIFKDHSLEKMALDTGKFQKAALFQDGRHGH